MRKATGSGSASNPDSTQTTRRGDASLLTLGAKLFPRSNEDGAGLELLSRFLCWETLVFGSQFSDELLDGSLSLSLRHRLPIACAVNRIIADLYPIGLVS
jgi:hypothetical protein